MQPLTTTLTLEQIQSSGGQLTLRYTVDAHHFQTRIEYHDVDFDKLNARYGRSAIDRLLFYIAMFEGMKYCSLFPLYFDVSRYGIWLDQEAIELFSFVYTNVFAQHRWEHQYPEYHGPIIVNGNEPAESVEPVHIEPGLVTMLASCGGGKDSLVTMKLLERAGEPYAVSQYAHSIYGALEPQHQLIDRLAERGQAQRQHRIDIYDDFLPGDILQHPDFKGKVITLCAPETPCSVFETLPLALAHGYLFMSVGHERDADTGNFYWDAIEQEVNHQWGKSYAAELALNKYVQHHLIKNFTFFSMLKPIYDLLIFQLLRLDQEDVVYTHSCNLVKPWCKRCPKCVYVWLCCVAYLDNQRGDENLFGENLLNEPEVADIFLQLMGLRGHRPFECIGEVDHVRLAFYFCVQKGIEGKMLDVFTREILPELDIASLLAKYNRVYPEDQGIPSMLVERVWPLFEGARIEKSHTWL